MTEILLGATLPQFTDDRDSLLTGVRAAERAGLDSIWVFDHLWPLSGGKERPILECWTTLAWLAAQTDRIGIGTLVTRSSLRHPAILAKSAATVGAIAPGRVTITIGSGDQLSRDENIAFGLPYWEEEERVRQLASTVEVVVDYLNEESVSRRDSFVSIQDLPPSPRSDARVWVGGRSDDVISVAARRADGWNGWGGTPKRFAMDAHRVLDMAGDRAVELSWGGTAVLAASDDAARSALGTRDPKKTVWGAPERVAERLRDFAEAGARHLILTFGKFSVEQYELLGGPVRDHLMSGA